MLEDLRFIQLSKWIHQEWPDARIEVASADASFRRYFRVTSDGKTTIAMDAPPEQEDCTPFIDVTKRLLDAKVHAPEIIRQDLEQGFLLLEDFGSTPYLDELNSSSNTNKADHLYSDAMNALINIQQANTSGLPEYDADFLMLEMQYMPDWLLQTHLNITPTTKQQAAIGQCLRSIVNKVLEQPQVFVHRDYHSRNLMITAEDNPGVIDYQDAMLGPVTYDLVSLLRDCYIQWPNDQVEAWVLDFKEMLDESNLLSNSVPNLISNSVSKVNNNTFIEWFDYMGLQRHIKVLGIFARLNHRDGKSNYLNDLPLTLEYMMQVAQKYPETKPLYDLFIEWQIPKKVGLVNTP
ncbi:MAG: aminoglycoside/choline kinase family phosphotransferase [Cocleimonas sp.]|jgi:aminoglycoside/choline kinase family phosphotransferase